jgi:hypothetical protein
MHRTLASIGAAKGFGAGESPQLSPDMVYQYAL